jgi:hypothetical protein
MSLKLVLKFVKYFYDKYLLNFYLKIIIINNILHFQ